LETVYSINIKINLQTAGEVSSTLKSNFETK